jgi:hypothetical protein
MSAWQSENDAKATDDTARHWVTENMDARVIANGMGDFAWLEFAEQ